MSDARLEKIATKHADIATRGMEYEAPEMKGALRHTVRTAILNALHERASQEEPKKEYTFVDANRIDELLRAVSTATKNGYYCDAPLVVTANGDHTVPTYIQRMAKKVPRTEE